MLSASNSAGPSRKGQFSLSLDPTRSSDSFATTTCRLSKDRPRFPAAPSLVPSASAPAPAPSTTLTTTPDPLETIKFICKDIWIALYDKQIDNLRTNHRGVYVLQDNSFPPLLRISGNAGETAQIGAQVKLVSTIRGCAFAKAEMLTDSRTVVSRRAVWDHQRGAGEYWGSLYCHSGIFGTSSKYVSDSLRDVLRTVRRADLRLT